MRTDRPKAGLVLSEDDARSCKRSRSRSLPAALSNRARIILSSADAELNSAIAERLQMGNATVGKWRARFVARHIAGLYDDVRPDAPRALDDERVVQSDPNHIAYQAGRRLDTLERAFCRGRDRHLQEQLAALLQLLGCSLIVPRASGCPPTRPLSEAARRGRSVPESA